MAFFRHTFNFARQIWYAIDTASALKHGAPASEKARRHTAAKPAPVANSAA